LEEIQPKLVLLMNY